jgi:hypothetical protein
MATKYNKGPKISKLSVQTHTKLYQNWGLGLKINHLATLLATKPVDVVAGSPLPL